MSRREQRRPRQQPPPAHAEAPDRRPPAAAQPAQPFHLPRPTVWPAVLASGVTLLAWGVITNVAVSIAGLALFVVALWGWGREIVHEYRERGGGHGDRGGP
ncbi:MAG TPA: hypothetical protein VKV26_13345 [Dehalococcoidia bacterium]|nr:hypothetical protein [Dehalococcoidia bacterium]